MGSGRQWPLLGFEEVVFREVCHVRAGPLSSLQHISGGEMHLKPKSPCTGISRSHEKDVGGLSSQQILCKKELLNHHGSSST